MTPVMLACLNCHNHFPLEDFYVITRKNTEGKRYSYRLRRCKKCVRKRQNKMVALRKKMNGVDLRTVPIEKRADYIKKHLPMTGEGRRKAYLSNIGCKHSKLETREIGQDAVFVCYRCGTIWAKAKKEEDGTIHLNMDERPNRKFPNKRRYWSATDAVNHDRRAEEKNKRKKKQWLRGGEVTDDEQRAAIRTVAQGSK